MPVDHRQPAVRVFSAEAVPGRAATQGATITERRAHTYEHRVFK
jgi:hypothetical protein